MLVQVFFSIIAALGMIFNSLILYSVIKYKTLRKKSYVILVSLAVCDLLKVIILVNIVVYVSTEVSHNFCISTTAFGLTLICTTTLHLAFESLNRCLLVMSPFQYNTKVKKKTISLLLFLIWLLPLVFILAIPFLWLKDDWLNSFNFFSYMFGCSEVSSNKNTTSEILALEDREAVFLYTVHVLFFAIPLVIMVVSYGLMLKESYLAASKIRITEIKPSVKSGNNPAVTKSGYSSPIIEMVKTTYETTSVSKDLYIQEEIKHEERSGSFAKVTKELARVVKARKKELKASKTVLIVVLTFVLCNAPIFFITWRDLNIIEGQTSLLIRQVFVGIAFLQVFIDPAVYFLRLKDYTTIRNKCKRIGNSVILKTRRTIRRL